MDIMLNGERIRKIEMKFIFKCLYGSADVTTEIIQGISGRSLERLINTRLNKQIRLDDDWFVPVPIHWYMVEWLNSLIDEHCIEHTTLGSHTYIKALSKDDSS